MHTVGQQTAFPGIPLGRQLRFLGTIHSSTQPQDLCWKQIEKLQQNLKKREAKRKGLLQEETSDIPCSWLQKKSLKFYLLRDWPGVDLGANPTFFLSEIKRVSN